MNSIKANAVYLDPANVHPYEFIERVGRTCYKSEDRITDNSAEKFVKMLKSNNHTAMLEHAHVILRLPNTFLKEIVTYLETEACGTNCNNTSSTIRNYLNISILAPTCNCGFISGSFRAFMNLCESPVFAHSYEIRDVHRTLSKAYPELFKRDMPTDFEAFDIVTREEFINDIKSHFKSPAADNIISKHLTHTILFTCDRGVTHELVRHRPVGFAMESTRYCNYAKDKFESQINTIDPCFWENDESTAFHTIWESACNNAEASYLKLIELGATPQQARSVLPHSVKADIVMTATENEWKFIFDQRLKGKTGAPHPQMLEIMEIAAPALKEHSDGRLN